MKCKRILIVDDSRTARLLETRMLRSLPCEISLATDGADAVEKAIADPPDLILMDVEMPRLTGIEACRALRRADATRAIPVIFVTSHGDEATMLDAFGSDAIEFVTKPVDAHELLIKVRSALDL